MPTNIPDIVRGRVNAHMWTNYRVRSNNIWCHVGTSGTGQETYIRPYDEFKYMVCVTINLDDTISIGIYKQIEETRVQL